MVAVVSAVACSPALVASPLLLTSFLQQGFPQVLAVTNVPVVSCAAVDPTVAMVLTVVDVPGVPAG